MDGAVGMGMNVLVGAAGNMIVIQMHGMDPPFRFLLIILPLCTVVKEFLPGDPLPPVAKRVEIRYNTPK